MGMERLLAAIAVVTAAACAMPTSGSASRASVAGRTWVNAAPGIEEAQRPRLEFGKDGRLSGSTGCNMLSGSWSESGGTVKLAQLVATKRYCIGAGSELEKRFLAAVNGESRIEIAGSQLVAEGPHGERMEFAEASPAR
jgi:heat shock protein HslJ